MGHIYSLCARIAPRRLLPGRWAFSPSRLRVTGRGTSTVFAHELLPAGWLPGRRASPLSRLRVTGQTYPQPLGENRSPQAGCPADGAFSPSRLRVTGWGTSTAFVRELLPAGAHGTGLICSGAFPAKIDRCSRERLSPFFRFRSRKIHGKISAEPRTDRTEPAGSEPAIRKIRER